MKIKLASAKPIFSLAALIIILSSLAAFGQEPEPFSINTSPLPAPTSPVNDYAGVIDPATKTALEKRVTDFKTRSGVELAVAVVKTTGERPIFDYSLSVARGWGIGSKDVDNPSALLFVAIDDRKYFTQVSKDLEDELPDGVVGSLQRQFLVPEFRKQNYSKGIAGTVEAYIRTIEAKQSGTAPPATGTAEPRSDKSSTSFFSLFCCLAVILVIVLIAWSNRGGGGKSNRDNDRWGGGGFGGGGGVLPWIIGSAIGSSLGSSSSGSSSGWGSSGGSGGSDWGGFGGGGDFGGGGAGGDW